jgi:Ser/Thr protein kinase RdoA (MazF antagonist)
MDERYHGTANLPPEGMTLALHAAIIAHYALSFEVLRPLSGGEECEIWLVRSHQGQCVVRISPRWRSLARLGWVHTLLLALQPVLPVVIAPLKAPNGSTLLVYQEHPVVLFPYVDGHPVDREDPAQREAAAWVLAQLHRAMLSVSVPDAAFVWHLREASLASGSSGSAALRDAELESWHAALVQRSGLLTCGLIHGDYYRRNLLVSRGAITAVLDWDDAHLDFLMQEVAWSAWEFGKTASGDDWHPERARAFVETYRAAGGPCQTDEYSLLIPFIRWRLREEVRYNLAAAAAGERWDPEYVDAEVHAFQRLHGQSFTI